MTRTFSVLLMLALFAGSTRLSAAEPTSEAGQVGGNKGGEVNLTYEGPGADPCNRSLALPARQLALWIEEPQSAPPARPSGPTVLVPGPTGDTPPLPSGPIVPVPAGPLSPVPAVPAGPLSPVPAVPAGPLSPVPAVPAGPLSPIPAVPAGPAVPPAAVPEQGPKPPLLLDEKLAPSKDVGPSVPFNIMDSKRESELNVIRGRSLLLRSTIEFTRTAVVDPKICDLIQYSATELGFVGKALGTTQVTVWFRDSNDPNVDTQPRSFIVHVVPDLNAAEPHLKQLEAEIARLFPNSKVRLRTFGQRIIVLGQARDVSDAAEILNFIRGEQIDATGKWVSGPGQAETNAAGTGEAGGGGYMTPYGLVGRGGRGNTQTGYYSDRIINMLKVPGVHQIMLRVKIAELDRTAARNFGVNFSDTIQFHNGTLLLQSLLNASNTNSVIGNFNSGQLTFGISYLEQHGVVRLLSEPTLVTLSGKPANFIAGGEFAVPTVVGIGGAAASTTDFRAYGAIISFTPYLLDKDLIRLQITPEFSQIDTTTTVGGVPGLTTRTLTTTVELRAGQTLAVGGLLDESMKSTTEADWPLIGKLLGPRSVNRSETELLVLVTPELVHPMEPEEVPPMPGFDVTEPDNIQFFLRGDIEGNPTRDYRSTVWPILQQRYRAGGSPMISGPFGHSNPWTGDPSNCHN
jgi:pilus assembly protein CpaC